MLDNVSVAAYLNYQLGTVSGYLSVDTSVLAMDKVAGCEAYGEVHSRQAECHRRSAQLAQPGRADGVVTPF